MIASTSASFPIVSRIVNHKREAELFLWNHKTHVYERLHNAPRYGVTLYVKQKADITIVQSSFACLFKVTPQQALHFLHTKYQFQSRFENVSRHKNQSQLFRWFT